MINLDYKDKRPIYEQIIDKMKELMVMGVIPENAQLPSVRSLAVELSINPNTIQRAYAELERQGYHVSVGLKSGRYPGALSALIKESEKRMYAAKQRFYAEKNRAPRVSRSHPG